MRMYTQNYETYNFFKIERNEHDKSNTDVNNYSVDFAV